MITPEEITEARKTLEARWDDEGDCGSCGWHACLYEHNVTDLQIVKALETEGGILTLGCLNQDDKDSWNHRGVSICIGRTASEAYDV